MPLSPLPPLPLRCEPYTFTLQIQSPRPEFLQAGLSRSQVRVAPRLKNAHPEIPGLLGQRGVPKVNYARKPKADSFSLVECQRDRSNLLLTASLNRSDINSADRYQVINAPIPGTQIQSTWKKLQGSAQWASRFSAQGAVPTQLEQLSELLGLGTQILSESRSIDWHQPAYHAKLVIYQPGSGPSTGHGKKPPRLLQEIRKPFHYNGFMQDLVGVFITGQLTEESILQYGSNRVGSLAARVGYELNPTHWHSPLANASSGQPQQIQLTPEAFQAMAQTAGQYGYQWDQPEQQEHYIKDVFRMMQTIAENLSQKSRSSMARLGIACQSVGGKKYIMDLPLPESDNWA